MKSLTDVFAKLRKAKLIARQNFSCCGGCGLSEIMSDIEEKHLTPKGFVFFHRQDTEHWETAKSRKPNDAWLHVRFGSIQEGDDADKEIGEIVAKAFRDGGWDVDWDGDPRKTVTVREPVESVTVPTPAVERVEEKFVPTMEMVKPMSVPVPPRDPDAPKPVCQLSGADGNVFVLAGLVSRTLKKAGLRDQVEPFQKELFASGSYDQALQVMMRYVEVE